MRGIYFVDFTNLGVGLRLSTMANLSTIQCGFIRVASHILLNYLCMCNDLLASVRKMQGTEVNVVEKSTNQTVCIRYIFSNTLTSDVRNYEAVRIHASLISHVLLILKIIFELFTSSLFYV